MLLMATSVDTFTFNYRRTERDGNGEEKRTKSSPCGDVGDIQIIYRYMIVTLIKTGLRNSILTAVEVNKLDPGLALIKRET